MNRETSRCNMKVKESRIETRGRPAKPRLRQLTAHSTGSDILSQFKKAAIANLWSVAVVSVIHFRMLR